MVSQKDDSGMTSFFNKKYVSQSKGSISKVLWHMVFRK